MKRPGRQDWLTVRDVADLLRVSQRTVWRWLDRGILPSPIRVPPRFTRWRATEIERFLEGLQKGGKSW